ncbi:SLIT-ROBO Rho GTPase-activating protein 1 [Lates calcarifer]|uniref:SLIT-ROBO Rho GTPase-activating protein 1 n=1 Tax=Lates calcarifer TaxID=8187 RepID=A0AAJ7VDV9_LATCA|nr:SLIT-ROBO Rho GTPase-activating protein 1 [Lates calcarifer]
MESPPIRRSTSSGQYTGFSDAHHHHHHGGKPLDPESIAQDIEETMNTALNELRELERQSSAKHAPDVVLDTLEQRQTSGSSGGVPRRPAPATNTEPPIAASTSSSSDTMSTFKPVVAPRMGVQLKPPALRPKPMVLPKSSQAPQPPAASSQDPLDKSCTM